jgi:hypothetical protein
VRQRPHRRKSLQLPGLKVQPWNAWRIVFVDHRQTRSQRGADTFTEGLFTMPRLDNFVPEQHPLQRVRRMVNETLAKIDELFPRMYAPEVKR